MFGKLLKYEFKSLGKWYLSLYAVVGLLSVVIGFWVRTFIERSQQQVNYLDNGLGNSEMWLFIITIVAFAILVAGLMFATFFLVVSRFYNNIYGRQGYLTMTLPVTSHQLILSKLVSALIWYFLAGLVVILGIFAIILFANIPETVISFNQVLDELSFTHISSFSLFLLSSFVDSIMGILLSYFAISLGQLFRDHRILLAIAFYIGIQFVMGIFQSFAVFSSLYLYTNDDVFFNPNPILLVGNLLCAIAFYFGTHYIMTKKLNLQ